VLRKAGTNLGVCHELRLLVGVAASFDVAGSWNLLEKTKETCVLVLGDSPRRLVQNSISFMIENFTNSREVSKPPLL
jgi:hypothetical protein